MGTKPKLYRLIADCKTPVFDNLLFVDENKGKISNELFIKENKNLTSTFNFWTSTAKKDLVNYINKRFGTSFKSKNFKNEFEAINFIVQKS